MSQSERAPRPVQESPWPGRPGPRGVLLYIGGLAVVFGLLTTIASIGQPRSTSYTEFKQLVRAGKVLSVTIDEDRISRRLLEREVVDGDEVRRIVSAPEKNVNAA